jgi:hypothetical protein
MELTLLLPGWDLGYGISFTFVAFMECVRRSSIDRWRERDDHKSARVLDFLASFIGLSFLVHEPSWWLTHYDSFKKESSHREAVDFCLLLLVYC